MFKNVLITFLKRLFTHCFQRCSAPISFTVLWIVPWGFAGGNSHWTLCSPRQWSRWSWLASKQSDMVGTHFFAYFISLLLSIYGWFRFDSTSSTDVNMLDLLRIMCQQHNMGRMVHQIAQFVEQADKAIKVREFFFCNPYSVNYKKHFQPQEVGFDVSSNAEYVLSQVDATELMLIGNSAAEMSRSGFSVCRLSVWIKHKRNRVNSLKNRRNSLLCSIYKRCWPVAIILDLMILDLYFWENP